MALTKSQLARQIRGNLELLAAGGVNELPVKLPPPPPAPSRGKPARAPAPAARAAAATQPAAQVGPKPVIVASAALDELKQFEGP